MMFLQSPFKRKDLEKVSPADEVDNTALRDDDGKSAVITKSSSIVNKKTNTLSHIMNIPMLTYVVVVILTVSAMLVPLFVEVSRIQYISESIFGDALRTSTRLIIMESISIGCTLPTLSDVLLDRFTSDDQKTKMTLTMWHRIFFLLTFSIAGLVYLSFSDYYFMAYLYIFFNRIKVILVGAVTSYAVSSGTVMGSLRSKICFLIPVLICAIRFVIEAYSLVYPENRLLSLLTGILYYLSFISFFGVHIPWYYLLWRRYRVNKILTNEEKKEAVYMLAMLFYIVVSTIINVFFGWADPWAETVGDNLVGFIAVQIVCILLATVLPTRFMRKVVQVNANTL